jgi:hypothetical protein
MLEKHRSMWNGRLSQVHSTAHRIELPPGQKPVHCQPYLAGPRARTLESAEIKRMLKAEVIDIRLLEGASFSPDRLHNRPEAARYLLTLVTACSDRDTHTLSKFS